MNKKLIIFLLFSLIELCFCCSSTTLLTSNITFCNTFANGSKLCEVKISGFLSLINNEEFCAEIKIDGTVYGRIEMRVIEVKYYPICNKIYWTSGYEYSNPEEVINYVSLLQPVILPINEGVCFNDINTVLGDLPFCKCVLKCVSFSYRDKLSRNCYDIFNNNTLSKSLGYNDCIYKFFDLGQVKFYDTRFYSISVIPTLKDTFEVRECSNSGGDRITKIKIDFYDISHYNKPHEEIEKILPNNTQYFYLKGNNIDEEIFYGFEFKDVSLIINNPFPSKTRYLIPPINGISDENCYHTANAFDVDNIPNKGIGEIQGFTQEDLFFKSPFDLINKTLNVQYFELNNLKASRAIFKIGTIFDGGIEKWDIQIGSPAIETRFTDSVNIHKLPFHGSPFGDWNVSCDHEDQNKIYSLYDGKKTLNLQIKMLSNYKIFVQTNEIRPLISSCSKPQGYKNSTIGSNMTFMAKSTTFKGSVNIYLGDSNDVNEGLNDLKIYSSESIFLDTTDKLFTLVFNLNTNQKTVNIIVMLVGTNGYNSSCSVFYDPLEPQPDKTRWDKPDTGEVNTIIGCGLLPCFNGDLFDWLNDLFMGENLFDWLLKILIVVIPIIIIGIVIYCIISCVINQSKQQSIKIERV